MYDVLKYKYCNHSRDPIISCALEGVANIIAGIKDVSIVIHSPQGCSSTVATAYDHHEIDFSKRKIACSRLFEMDIVMGATEKLKNLIIQADRVFNAAVLFVVGTCAADIIGEDIEGLCHEMQAQVNAKLIPVIAGGFRGTSYDGMNLGLDALLPFISPVNIPCKISKSVNLIAPQSSINPTWWADLNWVKDTLALMGVGVNTVISHDISLEELKHASEASANILLSRDVGYSFAEKMEQKFGVPLVLSDISLPVGCTNTAQWLRAAGKLWGAEDVAENLIKRGEEHVVDILRRRGLMIIPRYRNCHVAVSADATWGISILRMLFDELEMIPELVLLRTESENIKQLLNSELDKMGISPKVAFSADGYVIKNALAESSVDAVFGSAWERYISQEVGIKLSFDLFSPTNRDIYQDKVYFGYDGMLNMLEITGNDWESQFRSKEIHWANYQEQE
jgi:light-independent protochlorophyllide reductase B subunit